MKKMKKLLAIALTLVLAMALAVPCLAAQGGNGTLDITKAKKGEEYNVYRVLDLDYVKSGENESYSYTVNDNFVQFFKDNLPAKYMDQKVTPNVEKESFDSSGNPLPTAVFYFIQNITEFKDSQNKSLSMSWLANSLAQYVLDNKIASNGHAKCEVEGSAKINYLLYGYYLMIPTGEHNSAMFSLSSAIPDATIENKSTYPTPEKVVKDSDETTYGKTNTASIGETVDFKITGTVPRMTDYSYYKFVITDTMPNFTYTKGSAVLKIGDTTITKDNYLGLEEPNSSNTLVWDDTAKTLTVTIPDLKLFHSARAGATIELTYKAVLTDSAGLVVGGAGNANEVKFTYSNDPRTDTTHDSIPSETRTFVLQLHLDKVDSAGKAIKGATWKLEKKLSDTEWKDVKDLTNGKPVFTPEGGSYTYNGAASPTTNGDGIFTWTGIDQGTYRLTEVEAPPGHVRIENPIVFSVTAKGEITGTAPHLDTLLITLASIGGHPSVLERGANAPTGVVTMKVQNVSQSALPSTGGAGLYVIAGVAVVALLGFGGTALLKRKVNAN